MEEIASGESAPSATGFDSFSDVSSSVMSGFPRKTRLAMSPTDSGIRGSPDVPDLDVWPQLQAARVTVDGLGIAFQFHQDAGQGHVRGPMIGPKTQGGGEVGQGALQLASFGKDHAALPGRVVEQFLEAAARRGARAGRQLDLVPCRDVVARSAAHGEGEIWRARPADAP